MATIYMPLVDGGAAAWLPIEATQLRDGRYRVRGPVPPDEEWVFAPGTVVVCEWRPFSDGKEGPVAIRIER